MCEICHMSICPGGCPNAKEPKMVFICSGCGEPILEGDDYWNIMGEQWCKKCIDNAQGVAEYDP